MSEAQRQEPDEHQDQRIYTREFKLGAVRLSESNEKTVAQVAGDLGVPERVLYRWRHVLREQAERAFPGKGHQSELEEGNRRLRVGALCERKRVKCAGVVSAQRAEGSNHGPLL